MLACTLIDVVYVMCHVMWLQYVLTLCNASIPVCQYLTFHIRSLKYLCTYLKY